MHHNLEEDVLEDITIMRDFLLFSTVVHFINLLLQCLPEAFAMIANALALLNLIATLSFVEFTEAAWDLQNDTADMTERALVVGIWI